jgi:lycopene cyclase domain-containing protein
VQRFQYLIVMALCVAVTLPLEFILNARVYRRPRRMFGALLPTVAAFVVWDMFAIRLGHWTFSPDYTRPPNYTSPPTAPSPEPTAAPSKTRYPSLPPQYTRRPSKVSG